jgi:hypothetical protein
MKDGLALRYAILFLAEGGDNYFLSVSAAES